MDFFRLLLSNTILISAAFAWFVAQLLKVFIDMWRYKSFSLKKMFESGGMPSSHSSTVSALASSSLLVYGISSFEFAVTFILATIVMYDALGVRRETGKQAKLLNIFLDSDIFKSTDMEVFDEKLKELVGHTPIQVFMGAVLGIIIGVLFVV